MVNHFDYKGYWIDIFTFNLSNERKVTHGFINKEGNNSGVIFCSNELHAKQIIDSHTEEELINALGKNYAIYARFDFVNRKKWVNSFRLDNIEFCRYHKLSPSPDPYDINEWCSFPFCLDVNINCNIFDREKLVRNLSSM